MVRDPRAGFQRGTVRLVSDMADMPSAVGSPASVAGFVVGGRAKSAGE
jgi:hypothetical protein